MTERTKRDGTTRLFLIGTENSSGAAPSSVRYRIPRGHIYRLYKEPGHPPGGTRGDAFIDLEGDGNVKVIRNLKKKPHEFGDKVSSSKYLTA